MFAASKTDSVSGETPDPQFNYVTMLLHGDGTNGAQNNTFLDSSTNNFTITRNGNTTQGSFSPYGSNWGNYFDGSSYLSFPSNNAFALPSDFTLECWVNPKNWDAANIFILGLYSPSENTGGLMLGKNGGNFVIRAANTDPNQLTYATFPTLNVWTHIVAVRSGTTLSMYYDGVRVATTTNSYSFAQSRPSVASEGGGSNYTGYISNLRLVKGTAIYNPTLSTLNVPTTPLTAVSGTTLLTCQSNRFIDTSSNAFLATITGTPSVQRFNPFGTYTAYSTSVIGGSGYFDGTGDYLGCGSQSAYAFGAGDFTLNVWVYLTSAPTYMSIADTRNSGWALAIDASRAIYLYSDAVGFVVTSAVGAVPFNAWTYVTVTRVSGTMTLYLNAVSINSAANSTNFSNTTLTVGANSSGAEPFFGYICDFQAIKGTGTTPTLPTAPLTNVTNTSLLLNYTNGAIFDNAMMNDLETVGNAQISTSVVKYGTGSIYFDGTGDGLFTKTTQTLAFGTGDFTVEFWLYLAANLNAFANVIQMGTTAAFTIEAQATVNVLNLTDYESTVYFASNTALTTGTWIHVAATRASGTLRLFQNGIQVGSAANTANLTNTGTGVYIGKGSDASSEINGYIDDLRITKGYARYTANFTPPTAAFPNTGPY